MDDIHYRSTMGYSEANQSWATWEAGLLSHRSFVEYHADRMEAQRRLAERKAKERRELGIVEHWA